MSFHDSIALVPSRHILCFPDTRPLSRATPDRVLHDHVVTTTGFGTGVGLILEYYHANGGENWELRVGDE